jgi:hypothetical protein
MRERIVGFGSAVAGTPVANRRSGIRDTTASMRTRALALGFLLGLASSVGLWIYTKWVARLEAVEQPS